MRFSVAIPVLGQAQFLPTALASLDAQDAEFEVAVMDVTPDDSVQLILKHWGRPIGYSRHGPDEGQAAAIQEG
jgi:glycosyltransferase involved in cell wall biosynthesis